VRRNRSFFSGLLLLVRAVVNKGRRRVAIFFALAAYLFVQTLLLTNYMLVRDHVRWVLLSGAYQAKEQSGLGKERTVKKISLCNLGPVQLSHCHCFRAHAQKTISQRHVATASLRSAARRSSSVSTSTSASVAMPCCSSRGRTARRIAATGLAAVGVSTFASARTRSTARPAAESAA
jgi:hypothetical protein